MKRRIIIAALAIGAPWLAPGSSGAAGSYTATANARLVGVDFTAVPAIAFEQLVDAGVSVAQTEIDSLGTTRGFASSPYPSNSVVLLPGLVAGVSGGQTSDLLPPYPLIAATNETTPTDRRELGTIVLDAASTTGNSRATVTDGLTSAAATTTADGSRVVARAETTISSIQLTSVLSLDGVHTVAEAVRTPGGDVELASSFEVAAITILGQRVALTPQSLSLLGTDVPLGIDLAGVLQALLADLAAEGTQLEFVPAVETEDGVTAAGLRITTAVPAPPQVASGLQELRAQVTLGLASVSVSNRAIGRPGVGGLVTDPTPDVVSPSASGGAPSSSVGAQAAAPTRVGVAAAQPGAGGGPVATSPASSTTPLPVDLSLATFYPVLVLAGVVGTGLVHLVRHLGVRSP